MGKKSGTAGTPVEPTEPDTAEDADEADPGKVSTVKAEQAQMKSGKYGSEKVKAHKPASDDAADEKKKSWVEIELKDDKNNPIPGEKFEVKLPDGSVSEGTLDEKGFARIEGFEKGSCQIKFPRMDGESWKKA